ncbi:MATE family efflux transporter [Candidatus Riesia sp. GBBU]|nr:MATE family efflux transporter [Candidatus Riesia sp. GBBU]
MNRSKNFSLYSLSWPIFVDILLHFSTILINTYMIGRVSTAYLAAIGIGNQIFDLFITIFNFISVGCGVVVSHYLGAGKNDKANQAIHISLAFNFIIGFLSTSIVLLFSNDVLNIMNTPTHLLIHSHTYLSTLSFSLTLESISVILSTCLRVYGKSKFAMFITFIANIITILGNLAVLYGFFGFPKFGLIGVSCSTAFGKLCSIILLFSFLFYRMKINFIPIFLLRWSSQILKKILQIGLPAAGENLVWILQYMISSAFINLIGETALAAQTLYFQMSLFIMLFGISIGIGNEIIIGHLIGARRFNCAYKRGTKSLTIGFFITIIMVFIFWCFRVSLLGLVTKDQNIIKILSPIFLISIFLEPGRTLNIIVVNSLRATGDAKFPFFIAIISMWGIAIPIGYFFGIKMEMGLAGIWIGFLLDEWIRGFINSCRWFSRTWEKNSIKK